MLVNAPLLFALPPFHLHTQNEKEVETAKPNAQVLERSPIDLANNEVGSNVQETKGNV